MNAHERRRLKRIRLRQRESAERKLSRGDWAFVKTHTPHPKRICVMSDAESRRFHDVSIGHRCTSTSHRHFTRKHVDRLVKDEVLTWVGGHFKIAAWIREMHWENRDGAMQLLPGNSSKRGARQGCSNMPQLSQFRSGNAAMVNDGRVD